VKKPRANKYLTLLENDLALERKRAERLEKDLEFFQGKCERLELALAKNPQGLLQSGQTTPLPPAPPAPPQQGPRRMSRADILSAWNEKSEAEQNEILERGEWDPTKEVNNARQ